ncbi:hypothetical protein [Methylobacterium sp. Leaf118]|uniref:hypothetical protein n=1 Tax=Methylobacterium sp. Leaf118 TaxID=2876562 RepID=UPI001E5A09ED|nr:hypothetical protein [Methylobacterium sp. Leaf118]
MRRLSALNISDDRHQLIGRESSDLRALNSVPKRFHVQAMPTQHPLASSDRVRPWCRSCQRSSETPSEQVRINNEPKFPATVSKPRNLSKPNCC